LESYCEKLRSGEKLPRGELHRLADLITYVPLDQLNPGRLSALLKSMGVDPDFRSAKTLEILSEIIGVNGASPGQAGPAQGSERLAELLRTGIPHQVLNAKYHEQEAGIIANAGRSKTMTIATNMAGRGVDILLGGNLQRVAEEVLQERGIDLQEADENQRAAALEEAKRRCEEDRKKVIELSGLHILGTERHESRRIDNQLRGRSGRQGDPGTSRFYVSLEDELWRLYGVERFDFLLSKWNECEPVESRIVSKQIEGAQGKVEAHHFHMRQQLLRYDDVKNLQREVIYKQRRRVLEGADLRESIVESMQKWVADRVSQYASPEVHPDEWDFAGLLQAMRDMFPLDLFVSESQVKETRAFNSLVQLLQEAIVAAYEDKEQQVEPEQMRELERRITLWVIDLKWVDHLDALEFLEEGIGYRGYAGVDPLVAFQKEAFELWQSLQVSIQEDIIRFLFRAQVAQAPRHTSRVAGSQMVRRQTLPEDEDEGEEARPAPVRLKSKVGRNDPCPCGSGKKYKKCCLNKAA
jgi:preprotein translocase subunit SecA